METARLGHSCGLHRGKLVQSILHWREIFPMNPSVPMTSAAPSWSDKARAAAAVYALSARGEQAIIAMFALLALLFAATWLALGLMGQGLGDVGFFLPNLLLMGSLMAFQYLVARSAVWQENATALDQEIGRRNTVLHEVLKTPSLVDQDIRYQRDRHRWLVFHLMLVAYFSFRFGWMLANR